MKQLVMTGPKQSKLIEVPMPKISNADQIIVKVKYCGVCMSEHYDWSVAKEGKTFGHEPVGIVYAVGEGVTRVKVGDRVSGLFAGNAEYVLASEIDVFKLPDNISDEDATLEPLTCLISAVSKARINMIGEKVAVVGCGYMGCGAISLLKMRGAYVVAIDIRRECLEDAKRIGADEVYTPDELPARYYYVVGSGLTFEGEPGGFTTVMEWGETAESLDLAINITRMCGQLCIGAYHTGGKRLVDVQQLNVKAIDCLSTHPRERDMNRTGCERAIKMLSDGSWNFKGLPTKIYPVALFDTAHAELEEKYGRYMKALVDFERADFEPYIINEI